VGPAGASGLMARAARGVQMSDWKRFWPMCEACVFHEENDEGEPVCNGRPPSDGESNVWVISGLDCVPDCAPDRLACAVFMDKVHLYGLREFLKRERESCEVGEEERKGLSYV